ncbi:hypothetical protein TNCV_1357961 [Trichonephila clavipes]|uniref:Uncharacterized protein n=1 Tax=Trichonephila clavipes TaxID=2585209 RepID=A0A8X6VJL5_TRICX|nr:hypothetical protein TNCV_1357961 [Trichonephila clavipes]
MLWESIAGTRSKTWMPRLPCVASLLFRTTQNLRYTLNLSRLKRPPVNGTWKLGEGCQLIGRPRHLTMVQNDVILIAE